MTVQTPAWVRDAVFYQIFPDRFARSERVVKPGPLEDWDAPPTTHGFKGGDLLGIAEHLDDLADLGITALYLNPILTSASNHRYHTDDYGTVDPLLGGDAALRELLDACHARGMRVILDGVFNHSGRGWFPFHHLMENGAASPYRDWFWIDPSRLDAGRRLQAYPDEQLEAEIRRIAQAEHLEAGLASERVLGYRGWWDLPALPKIRVDHPPARAHLLEIAERWIRFGADGWRLDVPQEVPKAFWHEFHDRVRAVDPDAYLVGEIWHVAPEWTAGRLFDGLMDYPLLEAILGFVARDLDFGVIRQQQNLGANVRPLDGPGFVGRLQELLAAYDPAVIASHLNLLDSHDTPRFVTMASGDGASLALATLVQMTLPGAPSVYYGDEVGVEGQHDPDCRRAFPWDRSRWDHARRAFFRDAIHLRHDHPCLRHGETRVLGAAGHGIAYLRRDESESLVVGVNAGSESIELDLAVPDGVPFAGSELLRWESFLPSGSSAEQRDGRLRLSMPARSGIVVRLA